jgi:hypothetical protein
MWLCYVDESGSTGTSPADPRQPYHAVVAVMLPEDRALDLAVAVKALVAEYIPRRVSFGALLGREPAVPELRGADLFGNTKVWAQLDTKACNDVYQRAIGLLPQYGCELAYVRIDREALDIQHRDPYRHHVLALQFLAEELDEWLGTQSDPVRQRGLLVAAQRLHTEDFAIGLVANVPQWGSSIGPQRKLTRIVDTVHFVRSIDNPGVQLADLVAYALHRVWKMAPRRSRGPGDQFIAQLVDEVISPRIRTYKMFP